MSQPRRRFLREDLVLQACLEAHGAVRLEGRLADRALDSVLRTKRHLYSQERRAVAERVYLLLRRERLVDHLLGEVVKNHAGLSTTERDVWRFAIARVIDGEDVSAVAEASGLSGATLGPLHRLKDARSALARQPLEERFAVEASLPDFLARRFLEQLGPERAQREAEAMSQRAPLVVRANALKIRREELIEVLEKEGIDATPTARSPLGLTLSSRVNIFALASFRAGLYEIQDEGSQLLGMLVDAPPTRVVDACAGAGGKTLQLAAQMKNRGELFALDPDERRLTDLRRRARRAGVHNARVRVIPEGAEAVTALEDLHRKSDRVLVDAPCSGSGTFRRKPDARYRLDEATIAQHVARQRTLLERFSALVKPRGRLIYGTCSMLQEENEAVVADFLSHHPDFEKVDASSWVSADVVVDGFLKTSPALHDTDGFFGAVLIRA